MAQIIAHRGSSGNRPENTLPAFAEAIRVDVDVIELDVHLSKDQQLIVMHDESVNRTTNGRGFIHEKTLAEIKKLSVVSRFREYHATKVPTLKEVLDLLVMRNFRGVLLIEIKTDQVSYPGIETILARELNRQKWPFNYWYCSFNLVTLANIHTLEPRIPLALVSQSLQLELLRVVPSYIEGIHLNKNWLLKQPPFVSQTNFSIRSWTVNTQEEAEQLLRLGVKGLITDYPEKMRQIENSYRRGK
ncbi:MAG: glycerophosphodiester phosphodiesterase family protein [Enterococcus sp.]